MSASAPAAEAPVITTQPLVNPNNGFSQFKPAPNMEDPENAKEMAKRQAQESTMWCCIGLEDCCDCAECCVDCCQDTTELDNDGSGCGDCLDCCGEAAGCCSD